VARSKRTFWTPRIAFAGVLFFGTVACNALLGISDYEKAECDGGTCERVPGDATPRPPPMDASVVDAEFRDAPGTEPVRWASFRMPNYVPRDAGAPVDNAPMSYTVAPGEGLIDKLTGLVWRFPMPEGSTTLSYQEALERCASPWRLPSRIELVTLLDLAQPGAKVAPEFQSPAPGISQGVHWTLSEVRPFATETASRWVVDFGEGGVKKRAERTGRAAVLCVKGKTR
jgi:hypothetical protein